MSKNEDHPKKPILGTLFQETGTFVDGEGFHSPQVEFSLQIFQELWESGAIKKLKGNKLHVFLTIARYMDRRYFVCWPTQETIARDLGIGQDTVSNVVKKLEDDGFISREMNRKPDGTWDTTRYKIRQYSPELHIGKSDMDHIGKSDMDHIGKSDMDKTASEKEKEKNPDSGQKMSLIGKSHNNLLVGESVGESVEQPLLSDVNQFWEEAFDQQITAIQLQGLLYFGQQSGMDLNDILREAMLISIHYRKKKAEDPYSLVLTAVKQGGWDWSAGEASRPQKPQNDKKSPSKPKKSSTDKEIVKIQSIIMKEFDVDITTYQADKIKSAINSFKKKNQSTKNSSIDLTWKAIDLAKRRHVEGVVDPVAAILHEIQTGLNPINNGRSNKKDTKDDLPKAIWEAQEREAKGEVSKEEKVDPETEARLRAKLNRMQERLKQKHM